MQKCHTRRCILATGILATSAFGLLVNCGGGGSNGGVPVDAVHPSPDGGMATQVARPIPCDTNTPCKAGGSVACCNGFCADTSANPKNCGACGTSCSGEQFCDGKGCEDAVISNVCANPRATVVLDHLGVDDMAGVSMGAALASHCMPAPKMAQMAQDAGGVVDPATGRPTTGVGDTFVAGGGSYGQNGIAYIELTSPVSPVYLNTDGTTAHIKNRATGTDVVETMNAELTAHHDFFYVQLAVEPESGTLCFSAVGIEGPGTQAAGYYASTVIVPNLSMYTKAWYVFEWTDSNNDSTANEGDKFTMVGSGP